MFLFWVSSRTIAHKLYAHSTFLSFALKMFLCMLNTLPWLHLCVHLNCTPIRKFTRGKIPIPTLSFSLSISLLFFRVQFKTHTDSAPSAPPYQSDTALSFTLQLLCWHMRSGRGCNKSVYSTASTVRYPHDIQVFRQVWFSSDHAIADWELLLWTFNPCDLIVQELNDMIEKIAQCMLGFTRCTTNGEGETRVDPQNDCTTEKSAH